MAEKVRIRVSLDLTLEANDVLERLATRSGTTKSDVLRRAIALVEVAQDAKDRGHALAVAATDGAVVARIVGL